jgi:cell division protease FtsH
LFRLGIIVFDAFEASKPEEFVNHANRSYAIYILLFLAIISMVYFNMQQQALETRVIAINQLARILKLERFQGNRGRNDLTIAYKDGTNKDSTLDSQSGLVRSWFSWAFPPGSFRTRASKIVISKPGMMDTVLNIWCIFSPSSLCWEFLVLYAPGAGLQ